MKKLQRYMTTSTCLVSLLSVAMPGVGYAGDDELTELLQLPLDQIVGIEGTIVSDQKKEEAASSRQLGKISEAPAAAYIVTAEDIRRSGARSIPDALRMVPGVQVAQGGANQWAISIRGFNDQYANKLLVMIDGRTVYTPIYGGVNWDIQDLPISSISRIEVVRGPGGTMWGANAVNGVINIVTKKAKTTQGMMVSTTVGTGDRVADFQQSGKFGKNGFYRGYVRQHSYDETYLATGDKSGASNAEGITRTGFKIDHNPTMNDNVMFDADVYQSTRDINPTTVTVPPVSYKDEMKSKGGHILSRWERALSNTSSMSIQGYFDTTDRAYNLANEVVQTLDFDSQYNVQLSKRSEFSVGFGYRQFFVDTWADPRAVVTNPPKFTNNIYSGFIQNKLALVPNKVTLTVGSKVEHNDYTGWEYQPSARLTWLPTGNQTVWIAASKAVVTPSVLNYYWSFPFQAPTGGLARIVKGSSVGYESGLPETVRAYELGYRIYPTTNVSVDTSLFYNKYNDLGGPKFINRTQAVLAPVGDGYTYGGELSTNWQVMETWDLKGGYNYVSMNLRESTKGLLNNNDRTPEHQFSLRSHKQFSHNVEMNNALYYVDNIVAPYVQSYYRFDTNFIWEPKRGFEVSVGGENLFDNKHQEYTGFSGVQPIEVGRTVYTSLKWKF